MNLEHKIHNARILVVDDEEANVLLLCEMLDSAGYSNVVGTCDSRETLSHFGGSPPDLLLLDLQMPHLDGFAIMEQLRPHRENSFLPILVLTADVRLEAKEKALRVGATDFLTKPFEMTEALLRIRNLLRTRFLHLQVQNQKLRLEERVQERTRDLEAANVRITDYAAELQDAKTEILQRLALAAEHRDDDTGQHVRRVSQNCGLLAQALQLPPEDCDMVCRASTLHDVGKIGIPDAILLKPGKLTPEEFDVIKSHTVIGAKILSGSRSPLLQAAEEIALTHHEKWDGSGYNGLSGEAIPIGGRIVAVADVFDALTHERPYKKAWPLEEAIAEIERGAGKHFDPCIVEAFLSLPHEEMI